MDNHSVYQLVTRLCETYINSNNIGRQISKEKVKKARSKCYEVLLSKRSIKSYQYLKQNSDPMCNLLAWHFYLLWEGKAPKHAENLRLCTERLEELGVFNDNTFANVVAFLLQLRSVPKAQHRIMDITIDRHSFQKHTLYDEKKFHLPCLPRKKFDPDMFNLPKNLLSIEYKSISKPRERDEDAKFSENSSDDYGIRDEGYESPTKDADDIWEQAFRQPVNNYYNWETFGTYYSEKELPFICEAGSEPVEWLYNLTTLEKVVLDSNTKHVHIKILEKDFVKCVKYLLVGIESEIFKYNSGGQLEFVSGIGIEGLSPLAVSSYCKDLITAGSCYKGLCNLSTTCPIDQKSEQNGFIFLELCGSIKRYLAYYRVAVLSLSDTSTLLTVHHVTRTIRKHIAFLASLCKVGPFQESNTVLHGVTLLNNLYEYVTSTINEESLMVFYAVIYPCVKVYFKRFLQKWILEGVVQDPHDEFFIISNSKYINSRGRAYWTRSFTLREDIVPDFLAELRHDILFCGKAMNLLKLCLPNSALCLYILEHNPVLHCCLLPDQLSIIERNNYYYYLESTVLSGPRFSLAELITRTREQNMLFLHLVAKKRAATLLRIELERKQKSQLEFDKKQSQMKLLRTQYYEALAFKSEAIINKLEKELKIMEDDAKLEVLQNKIVEEEKAQLIDYYGKLNAEAEKRKNYYIRQLENLKCELNLITSEPLPDAATNMQDDLNINIEQSDDLACESSDSKSLRPELSAGESSDSKSSVNSFETAKTSILCLTADVSSSSLSLKDSNTQLLSNNELDVLNANENYDAHMELVPESYKHFLENKKAAERNKAKVLSLEMGVASEPTVTKKLESCPLTDAQKNRLKVMSSEFGVEVPVLAKKTSFSAAEVNKQKMLASNDCLNVYETFTNTNKILCDNENYINRNIEVDTNTNFIEMLNTKDELSALETLAITDIKKSQTLLLDFSKLTQKFSENPQINSIPKFELQRISPMSVDSISTATTPNFNMFHCSTAVTTAKTEYFSEAGFEFESDSRPVFEEYQRRKSEFITQSENVPPQFSHIDVEKINPGCLKFCLQQSVLVPLITQIQLVTNELLKYYINNLQYLQHLNSLRNYFFLLDGEFCRNITENLFGRLYDVNFPIDLINVHTLQMLVYNALDYSTKYETNSQYLSFKINNLPNVFNLCDPDVFDCLSLVYKISWPLNIILPVDTIAKYDQIFRFLLKVHRISWVLQNMFQDLKLLSKEMEKPYRILLMTSSHYLQLHHYRHVMTQFVQSLQNYIMGEVLQSSWHVFERDMESVTSFDQLYGLHSNYIKNILFLCLLNQKSATLKTALQKIFIVILKFFSYLRSRCWSIDDDNVYCHPNFSKLESLFNNFVDLVLYFFKLGHKVVKSGYQPQLMQLLDMLDVNNYYSRKLRNSNSSNASIHVSVSEP